MNNPTPAIQSYRDFYELESFPEPTVEQMRECLETYTQLIAKFGRKAVPYRTPELPIFMSAKKKTRVRAFMYLLFNVQVLSEHLASGEPADERKLTWRALVKCKLTPASDFIDRIEAGDIVEIYLLREQLQIYRSMTFFDICTMSVEELLFEPWYKLGSRPLWSFLALSRTVMRLQWGLMKTTSPWNVKPHIIVEYFGEKRRIEISFKYVSPVMEKGKPVAALSTNSSIVL